VKNPNNLIKKASPKATPFFKLTNYSEEQKKLVAVTGFFWDTLPLKTALAINAGDAYIFTYKALRF
jgi:hypothetical protein